MHAKVSVFEKEEKMRTDLSRNYLIIKKVLLMTCFLSVMMAGPTFGQASQEEDIALDKKAMMEVIDSVLAGFEKHYVYPDTAILMSRLVRNNLKEGKYDEIKDLKTLTSQLSDDLREVSKDLHIRITVMSPDDFSPAIGDTITYDKIAESARSNFGFRKVEWLPGNVGYVRLDQFADPVYAGETAVAAMNFLANCDAVIIDLRFNGGGEEKMVRLLSSYFFKEPTQINSLYFTETDSLEQSWTYSYVPGKKLIDADLYILTSPGTGSGAEAFTYGMKHSKRATIIGETTGGAAHWVEYFDFPNLKVRVKLPIARPINPVTKTSWERVGVVPHIDIPCSKAFDTAYKEALQRLLAKCTDEKKRQYLEWHMIAVEAQINPISLKLNDMRELTGEYAGGRYGIHIDEGNLFWRYSDGTDYILISLATDLFGFEDTDDIRVRIVREDTGAVSGFQLVDRGGEGPVRERTGDWKE